MEANFGYGERSKCHVYIANINRKAQLAIETKAATPDCKAPEQECFQQPIPHARRKTTDRLA